MCITAAHLGLIWSMPVGPLQSNASSLLQGSMMNAVREAGQVAECESNNCDRAEHDHIRRESNWTLTLSGCRHNTACVSAHIYIYIYIQTD